MPLVAGLCTRGHPDTVPPVEWYIATLAVEPAPLEPNNRLARYMESTEASPTDRSDAGPHARRRRRWVEAWLIVSFWACSFMLTVGRSALDPRGRGDSAGLDFVRVADEGVEYGIWLLLTPLILWIARKFSFERGVWARRLALHVFLALAAAVAIDGLGHIALHLVIDRPIRPFLLGRSLQTFRFLDELIVYLVVLAAGFARDYFLRYQERLREATELRAQTAELNANAVQLQAQLSEARLRALRMQINPHFLFNTLHTISTYIERDPRGVRRMIARLSDLLRYTLDKTDVNEVPLKQELGFVDGYLELQKIRFQDSLEVVYDVDPDVRDALVPNLILQPLVENAVRHGAGALESGGRVEVRAWREGEWLHLSIRDNGPGLPGAYTEPQRPAEGIGLRNTRARLEGLYGDTQNLVLEQQAAGGVDARIRIPFHTADDLYTTSVG